MCTNTAHTTPCASSPSCQKKCAIKTSPESSDLLNAVHTLEEHNLLLLALPPAAIQALNILTSHARQYATNPAPLTPVSLRMPHVS